MPLEKLPAATSGNFFVTFSVPGGGGSEPRRTCGRLHRLGNPTPMRPTGDGSHTIVELAAGTAYRFRYFLDGTRWENDWATDDYTADDYGGDDSVVDLTESASSLLLEQTASDTYLKVMPTLMSGDAITLAGALQISGQEHAAVLHYVLGEYPVPDVFQKTDLAYTG